MGLDAEEIREIIEAFMVEGGELLEHLDQDLVTLEEKASDSALLNRIFRALHTIKGNANFLLAEPVFAAMAQVAHAAEDVMGELRNGKLAMSHVVMDAILQGVDTIRKLFEQVKTGDKRIADVTSLVNRLRTFLPAPVTESGKPQLSLPVVSAQPTAAETSPAKPAEPASKGRDKDVIVSPAVALESAAEAAPSAASLPPQAAMQGSLSQEDLLELRQDFLEESQELIEKIDASLLKLEQNKGDRNLVDEIFRCVHTLKGTSSFLGFNRISQLAHTAEEVLKGVRAGTLVNSSPLLDSLLAAVDVWKKLFHDISGAESDEKIPVQAAMTQLHKFLIVPAATSAGSEPAENKPAEKPVPAEIEATAARLPSPEQKNGSISSAIAHAPQPSAPLPVHDLPAPKTGLSQSFTAKEGEAAKGETHSEQTIRVEATRLDKLMNLVGELVLGRNRLVQVMRSLSEKSGDERMGQDLAAAVDFLSFVTSDLQMAVLKTRMQPIGKIFNRFTRTVRDLARDLGKEVRLVIEGSETELDKSVIDELGDPLIHLLRNSVDHGIEKPQVRKERGKPETGTITLAALHAGNNILIEIRDDGKGIDAEVIKAKAIATKLVSSEDAERMTPHQILDFIFLPGFSTAAVVTNVSGRGVGMDVVKTCIERLNGSVELASEVGKGTLFTIRLPLTLAIIQALQVQVAGEIFAIPLGSVSETVRVYPHQVQTISGKEVICFRNAIIPLVHLETVFGMGVQPAPRDKIYVVLTGIADKKIGIVVDKIIRQEEIVVKSLGKLLENIPGISGACIGGDGHVHLILDIATLLRILPMNTMMFSAGGEAKKIKKVERRDKPPCIMVVEDSRSERKKTRMILENRGFKVIEAGDGREALSKLTDYPVDMVITDIEMPELDGYELTAKIREHKQYRTIPVVAVSSHKEMVDRIKGMESGINTYLPKPLQEEEILTAIKNLMA
jgi:two-component system chemotaxis sensor kinase CheA